jgi:HSP90 family molecular chaperone
MDTSTIDQAYGQLQAEFQDVAKSVQALAEKLQAASQGGDQNAKEWLLDLKQIALDVKDEQVQVNALLQAIHSYIDTTNQQVQQAPAQVVQQMPQMGGGLFGGGMGGGMFGNFLGGGFGRAIEMGAGIGLGEDIINSIF